VSRVDELLAWIDEGFDRKAWHGPTLRGALRGVTAGDAAWRPGPGRHNIWEIAVHAAYWKYTVTARLTGGPRGRFPLKGSNWFVRPEPAAGRGTDLTVAWRHDLALLDDEHRRLREVVAALEPAGLDAPAPGSAYTRAYLVRGVASHDLYHAGQVQLLKRLAR